MHRLHSNCYTVELAVLLSFQKLEQLARLLVRVGSRRLWD